MRITDELASVILMIELGEDASGGAVNDERIVARHLVIFELLIRLIVWIARFQVRNSSLQ